MSSNIIDFVNGPGSYNTPRRRTSAQKIIASSALVDDNNGGDGHNNDEQQQRSSSFVETALANNKDNGSSRIRGDRPRRPARRAPSFLRRQPESQVLDGIEAQVHRNLWRDLLLVVFGCIAMTAISYVENHASEERNMPRLFSSSSSSSSSQSTNGTNNNDHGIVDTGFYITTPIYYFLKNHRHTYNDFFAFCNSLILLIPGIHGAYTVYIGDYSYMFRIIFTQLLRSFCGWATYLPPSNQYLMSYYDFPDVVQCMFLAEVDCTSVDYDQQEDLPFVSFFSGHVATMVICANHMYLLGYYKWSILVHTFNVFQIIRLLATRGHYSIDIIVAWFIAVLGSNPAGRLGRYYSRGDSFSEMLVPQTATDAFESLTGIRQVKHELRVSTLLKHTDLQLMLRAIQQQEDEEAQRFLRRPSESMNFSGKAISEGEEDDQCEKVGLLLASRSE